jgi:hypothetical protein
MTQTLWEVPPPTKIGIPRATKALAGLASVILILGGLNLYSGMHHSSPTPSPLALQQLRPILPATVDPDAFNEDRDGTKELSLEDVNGKATIWEDSKSGARIFCFDSCMVLPASHHHRRHL